VQILVREGTNIASKKADSNPKTGFLAVAEKLARKYELLLILKPNISDDVAQSIVNRTKDIFEKGGEVSVEKWDKCRMAYPIKKYQDGLIYFFKASSKPHVTKELKSYYAVTEDILRFTLTVHS